MTNSPKDPSANTSTASQPASPQSPSQPPQPTLQQLQSQLQAANAQSAVLSQMLWNLIRRYEPEEQQVVVSCEASDELWQLAFLPAAQDNPNPNEQRILAGTLVPLSDSEQKRVVRYLRGTDKQMMDALEALQLPHPPQYVAKKIAPWLVWKVEGNVGHWRSVQAPSAMERAKNFVGVPKA